MLVTILLYIFGFAVIGNVLVMLGFSSLGSCPRCTRARGFATENNFDPKKKVFFNRRPDIVDAMFSRNLTLKNFLEMFQPHRDVRPAQKLPEIKPDMVAFLEPSRDLKVIWFGHSSLLLNVGGKIVLIDPVFSGSAAPVDFAVKRFQAPVLTLEELPQIDYVLISHDHYDHLDMASVKYFCDKTALFVAPLGVGDHLAYWGIARDKIVEKNWWQSASFEGIEFIATPAQHFSGRGVFDRNKTLWASWVLRSTNHNLYFSGDSGYDTHFKDIGDKYGPFDVAFIESGQYNKKWPEVHMPPEDAIKAYQDLQARKYFPIHWGMFVLSDHAWYDPMVQLSKLADASNATIVAPKLGQIVNLSQTFCNEAWWQLEH